MIVHGIMEGEAVGSEMDPPWRLDTTRQQEKAEADTYNKVRSEDVEWEMINIQ